MSIESENTVFIDHDTLSPRKDIAYHDLVIQCDIQIDGENLLVTEYVEKDPRYSKQKVVRVFNLNQVKSLLSKAVGEK